MADEPQKKKSFARRHWLESLGCLLVVVLPLSIMMPNFMRAQNRKPLMICKSNLKNIATSVEMYETDHAGLAPLSLDQLTPQYLRMIPKCKNMWGTETPYVYELKSNKAHKAEWLVVCTADHTPTGIGAGYPQYSSEMGFMLP